MYPHIREELDQDEYGTVFNSEKTYTGLAKILNRHGSAIIAWTEQQGSQMDIWLTVQPIQAGPVGRGLRATTDLFVAVIGFGAFGFEIDRNNALHAGYVAEKLSWGEVNITIEKITELIEGVIKELADDEEITVPGEKPAEVEDE